MTTRKPIILYAMPRVGATGLLTSTCKIHQYDEPFRTKHITLPLHLSEWENEQAKILLLWDHFLERLRSPDAAIKIHGRELRLPIAKYWFDRVQTTKSHDIFIIERNDRITSAISYLIADDFGFWEGEKSASDFPEKVVITQDQINDYERHLIQYLEFFPSYGTVITFDTAPPHIFDKSRIRTQNQHSINKFSRIENLDWVNEQLQHVLNNYKQRWDHAINTLKP